MFHELERINRRPEPFSNMTIQEMWADPHISAQMLRYHLDPSVDAASRRPEFMDRSVAWIADQFSLSSGSRVVDLGCGPGLYTSRLAAIGAAVSGVDFSSRSIAYARREAKRLGLSVEYVNADYLAWTPTDRFDLALMIYCDYGAMASSQRRLLLDRVRGLLAPGGAFLLDVHSLAALSDLEEVTAYAPMMMDGFWSPDPYFGFMSTFVYPEERASVDRYEIVDADRTRTFCNWIQYFDPDSLAAEMAAAGLVISDLVGDVAGAPYDADAHEFGAIARVAADERKA